MTFPLQDVMTAESAALRANGLRKIAKRMRRRAERSLLVFSDNTLRAEGMVVIAEAMFLERLASEYETGAEVPFLREVA